MNNITLSIAVALYNGEFYIERCLESIKESINRSKKINEVEVLVINDGSMDNSKLVVENYIKDNSKINIRLTDKKNGGLSDVRNLSIKESAGDYIWFIDCDDTITINAISTILKNIDDKKDIYIYGYSIFDNNGVFIKNTNTFDCNLNINNYLKIMKKFELNEFKQALFFEPASWHYIFKRKLYIDNKILFPLGKIYEDLTTTTKILLKAKKIKYISEEIYNYYWTDNSIIRDTNIKKRSMIMDALKEIKDYYINQDKFEEYKSEIEYLYIKHIHYIYNSIVKISDDELLEELSVFLKQEFPNWRKNKYLKEESIKTRFLYYLELNNMKKVLKFIQRR